jgi:hypothetical protein
MGWATEGSRFDFLQGQEICFFFMATRSPVDRNQPRVQCIPASVSEKVKRQEPEAHHSLPSSAAVENDGAIHAL